MWAELAKLHRVPFSNRLKVLTQQTLKTHHSAVQGGHSANCTLLARHTAKPAMYNVQCTMYNVHCTLSSHVCLGGVASVWDFHMLHSSHISHFAQCDKTSHTFVQFAQSVTGVLLVDATNSSVRHRQTSLSAPLCDSLHKV